MLNNFDFHEYQYEIINDENNKINDIDDIDEIDNIDDIDDIDNINDIDYRGHDKYDISTKIEE